MDIIDQIKARINQHRNNMASLIIDLSMLHIRLTHQQSLSIEDKYKDDPYNNTILGGISTYHVDNEDQSGLYVRDDDAPDPTSWYTRIGEPFTMDDTRSTNRRLNDIRTSYVPKGMPSDEEQQALVDWIVKSNTGGLDELPVMPDWYKPIAAYHQLRTMEATDHGKLAPWHIPTEWVNKLSAMWLCTMKANMIVHAQIEEAEAAQVEQSKRNPPAQSKFHIGKTDSRGGNA